MPFSATSFGESSDSRYDEHDNGSLYEIETIEFPGVTLDQAKTYLKRLGGGVDAKGRSVEGVGWKARLLPIDGGVSVTFEAHDELLDDLIRRFEEWTWK